VSREHHSRQAIHDQVHRPATSSGIEMKQIAASWGLLLGVPLTIALLGCDSGGVPLSVDARYSEYLSVLSQQYQSAARANAATTVKVVQLYGPGPVDEVSLRDATRGRLLYESRKPNEIESLFSGLQAQGTRGECELGDGPVLFVVAYDRDLPRVGILRLYECDAAGGRVIGVRPVGDSALEYSTAAATYLREIGALE